MLRDSEKFPEGRITRAVRENSAPVVQISLTDARALLQELVATRVHLALVANEEGTDPEAARSLARGFLEDRFPGGF